MGLFTPGWMNKDFNKALKCVNKLTNEEKLLRAALEAPDKRIQRKATQKLKSDGSLVRVLEGSEDRFCRQYAAEHIRDASLLAPYRRDKEFRVRHLALKRGGDEAGAFAEMKAAAENRLFFDTAYIISLADTLTQDETYALVVSTRHREIAEELVKKLDAALLDKLMREGECAFGAETAFKKNKPTEREKLLELAEVAKYKGVKQAALIQAGELSPAEAKRFLCDEDTIMIAMKFFGGSVWELHASANNAAVLKYGYERAYGELENVPTDRLMGICGDGTVDAKLRCRAFALCAERNLSDKLAFQLARTFDEAKQALCKDKGYSEAYDAVTKRVTSMNDQRLLHDAALQFGYGDAIDRLTDENLLAAIIVKKNSWFAKKAAARVTDQQTIAELLERELDKEVQEVLCENMTDQQGITKLLGHKLDEKARKVLLKNLTDKQALLRFIQEAPSDSAFCAAAQRIGELGGKDDVAVIAKYINNPNREQAAISCLMKLTGLTYDATLARFGTEETVKSYLTMLTDSNGCNERAALRALKALYRGGIGTATLSRLRGKQIRAHVDQNNSGCTPGWGHGDSHDDRAPLIFDI